MLKIIGVIKSVKYRSKSCKFWVLIGWKSFEVATITLYGITSLAPKSLFLFQIPLLLSVNFAALPYSFAVHRGTHIFLWALIFVLWVLTRKKHVMYVEKRCVGVSLHPEYIINASCFLPQNVNLWRRKLYIWWNYEHNFHWVIYDFYHVPNISR